jgi:peptide deformylase
MLMEILTNQNPILRKISKPVAKVTKEIKLLIENMTETMKEAPGVGLAAPQVGQSLRIIVADIGEGLHVIINPKLARKSGKQTFVEGCLSVPGVEAPVERYASICVKGLNIKGKPIEVKAEGLLATVIQHEMDHLEGHLFIDRVSDPSFIIFKLKTPKCEAL